MTNLKNLNLLRLSLMLIFLMFWGCRYTKPSLSFITGIYRGVLPCADCPGIQYQLNLKKDGSYHESRFYMDRDVIARLDSGKYRITADSIVMLDKKTSGFDRFKIRPDSSLLLLDKAGRQIDSGFMDQYIISKNSKPVRPEAYQTTTDQLNDFSATGNEPNWSLLIDFNKGMSFQSLTPESIRLNTPVPDPIHPQDLKGIAFRAENDSGMLHVLIVNDTCKDNMSGEILPYQVHVWVKTGNRADPVEFIGCGQYHGDYRLNDIWMLVTLDGKKIEIGAGSEHPSMELHLKDGKIIGTGGCNRFTGSVTFHKDKMAIGLLAATRMACPEMSLESAFFEAISDNSYSYVLDNNQLVLSNTSHQLVFQKTD